MSIDIKKVPVENSDTLRRLIESLLLWKLSLIEKWSSRGIHQNGQRMRCYSWMIEVLYASLRINDDL